MKLTKNLNLMMLTLFAAALMVFIPDLSIADDPLGDKLCNVAGWMTGTTGMTICMGAVIFVGVGAFFGKITWGVCLMTCAGIVCIVGSAEIVTAIDPEATGCGGV